ncbi:MAG: hypothetical protein WCZ72_12305 [Gemmobacter sp.]
MIEAAGVRPVIHTGAQHADTSAPSPTEAHRKNALASMAGLPTRERRQSIDEFKEIAKHL